MNLPAKRPLFRQEVIEFQQQSLKWGRVVPLQGMPLRLGIWFVVAAFASIIAFLFVAQYARKETVVGYLAPVAGTARIFAPQPGIISAVHVTQGQRVTEGQPLFNVAMEQIATNGADVNATVLATLERQRQSLLRQIETEHRREASERLRLAAQIKGLEAGIGDINAQLAVQYQRIGVLERLVGSGAQLAGRGLVSEVEQRRREDALLEQKLNFSSLRQQLTERQNQVTEARFNLEQLPFVTSEKVQQLTSDLSQAEQRIAEVDGRRAYVVRAPIAGRVAALQASVGKVADPRRLELQIVPGDSPLQAELFIPARAIGFIEPGQTVRILYEAFPYQQYGTYRARIIDVSPTLLDKTDVVAPIGLPGPAYRATALLDRAEIEAFGKRIPLQPDMLLRADVILERRTLVRWILNPILSVRLQG
ncbi:HlyD family efflux transporter periplasmic adaptor subunit [Roseicella aquatilis]|uniref:HlyD family efflux transporter periplasmic adaptor subunit n=2 Tax=Roseicella aquatilis TaxID=2527868 RepID=A0A4V2WJH3_9PROT|nr:HlyD family efflux transporter periplasmic adaptor subunit [Roseicella aquatilis]